MIDDARKHKREDKTDVYVRNSTELSTPDGTFMARGYFYRHFLRFNIFVWEILSHFRLESIKNRASQGFEQIALKLLWSQAAVEMSSTVTPVSCLEISFCFY
jgi:hypothetical protein